MKKTTNYQLNQWDETDRILREDFNADSAKIDAAIADLTQNVVLLKDITTTASAGKLKIDLSDVDFSKFKELRVLISFHCGSTQSYDVLFNDQHTDNTVICNYSSGTAGYSYGMVFGTPDGYLRPFSLNLLRLNLEIENANCACDSFCTFLYNEQSSVSACTRHTKCLSSVLKWNEVREMDLYSAQGGYPINAGAKIQIRGVRR